MLRGDFGLRTIDKNQRNVVGPSLFFIPKLLEGETSWQGTFSFFLLTSVDPQRVEASTASLGTLGYPPLEFC
jgi:hypothetical protein